MRIVVTADWHLDAVTNGVTRYSDLTRALGNIMENALKFKPDVFFFCGDLCNPDKGARTLRAIATASFYARTLSEYGIDSFWVAGNHDVVDTNEVLTTLSPIGVGRCTVVEKPTSISYRKDWQFIFVPYVTRLLQDEYNVEKYVEQECILASDEGKRIIIAGHCTNVFGAKDGTETTIMPRGRTMTFPSRVGKHYGAIMFNGHYHTRQCTPEGVWIPGSLARFDHGESKNVPSYYTIETEAGHGT